MHKKDFYITNQFYIQKQTMLYTKKSVIFKNKLFYIQKNYIQKQTILYTKNVLCAKQKCYIQQAAKTCNVQQQKQHIYTTKNLLYTNK